MRKLAQRNKPKLLDLLNERLKYERSSVKLYDSLIEKVKRAGDANIMRMMPQLKEHRGQENEHAEWLEQQIRDLGGNAQADTDMSQLIQKEAKGIEEVMLDGDMNIMHQFHALMAAELVDNAGWDLLVQLADEADDGDARRAFKKCLHEEEEHLELVQKAMGDFMREAVLKEPARMPTSP